MLPHAVEGDVFVRGRSMYMGDGLGVGREAALVTNLESYIGWYEGCDGLKQVSLAKRGQMGPGGKEMVQRVQMLTWEVSTDSRECTQNDLFCGEGMILILIFKFRASRVRE